MFLKCALRTTAALGALSFACQAQAQDARWRQTPPANDWNRADDWEPAAVPTGTATFGPSTVTSIDFTAPEIIIGTIRLEAGAPAYRFTVNNGERLRFEGAGIDNLSSNRPTLRISPAVSNGPDPSITFRGASSAANAGIEVRGLLRLEGTSTAASATIDNFARVEFIDSSSGGQAAITNNSFLFFVGTSTAGRAIIDNAAALSIGTGSSAGDSAITNTNANISVGGTLANSRVTNNPGTGRRAIGVFTLPSTGLGSFTSNTETLTGAVVVHGTGGTSQITNNAGSGTYRPQERFPGATQMNLSNSSVTHFTATGTAGAATITNNGGTNDFLLRITGPRDAQYIESNNAALTFFSGQATGGTSTIVNRNGAATIFFDDSNAGSATIVATGGASGFTFGPALVEFRGASSAGSARLEIAPATSLTPSSGGALVFRDTSTAGSATIDTRAAIAFFADDSNAGSASIVNHFSLRFDDRSSARRAVIDNRSGLTFFEAATADDAAITNTNAFTRFAGTTAATSDIVNNPGAPREGAGLITVAPTSLGTIVGGATNIPGSRSSQTGAVLFEFGGTAASANIVNNAGAADFRQRDRVSPDTPEMNLSNSSVAIFDEDSTQTARTTAGSATITNNGGTANAFLRIAGPRATQFIESNNAALTLFAGSSTAGTATIVNNNAAWTVFFDTSTAGAATITTNNGSTVLFRDASSGGTARFINNAGGTLDISGLTAPGTQVGSVEGAGAIRLGGRRLTLGGNNRSTEISGIISDGGFSGGTGGSLVKTGTGTLTLSGASTFTGGTTVGAGTMVLTGSLTSGAQVSAGARLAGTGRAGSLGVAGTLAPGISGVGTFNVTGNASFAAGSTYEVEVDPAGASDRLLVGGTATLQAGTVSALFLGTQENRCGAPIRTAIVTAQGGVTGTFAGVTSNFAFLTPSLSYDANNVFLTLTRNAATFGERGATDNQRAAAVAAEALKCGNALFDPLVQLSPAAAQTAFEQISGEIHPSARGALMDDSRFVRQAIASGRLDGRGFWASGYGSWGEIEGDGNAAAVDRDSSGLFGGFELALGPGFSAGVAGGRSRAGFDIDARSSEADLTSWHAAVYATARFGGFRLLAGGAIAWHEVETARSIVFTGFSDAPTARYDGRTRQLFAEASYALPLGAASLEPFVGIARVRVKTDGFTEAGGASGLTGQEESDSATFTTLGLRASIGLGPVSLTGSAAWRHASSLETSRSTLAFGAAGTPFTVVGAPIAEEALLAEAGVQVDLGGARLRVVYSGQFADETDDHGARATLSLPF